MKKETADAKEILLKSDQVDLLSFQLICNK